MTIEQILEIVEKYKLRMPPTVYYDLLSDVVEVEEEQEPTTKNAIEGFIKEHTRGGLKFINLEHGEKKNIFSVTPQEPRWIPTAERLPKEDGEYLATIYDMDENHEYMDIAELEDGKWCYKPYILVKAWMPLPTKYEGAEE